MLEFLHSHSSVVFQPDFDDPRFSGLNPYALGFAMMSDIQRICAEPDRGGPRWFPEIAGSGDAMGVLREAWANYRDESFILQYMSPEVIRNFRLFAVQRQLQDAGPAGRGDPRRARLPARPQPAVAAIRRLARRTPTCRSSMSI